ncbi:hypothetical protein AB0L82_42300 [Nocardia sp. NPDC052001]|uniref:hypothetical protein n=1 Tax=Nocardia sp. NPDC052001 TaxID=3154853 RepID=UPI003431F66E
MTAADQLRAEGRREGHAEGLLDLLASKFGEVPERVDVFVRGADVARLRIWNARVLAAETLDEVFAE